MSKVPDVFLHHGFFNLQVNVKEHSILHIPCGKVSEDNYCLLPRKHFKIVSTLSFGRCDVATWDSIKSTLKQCCVFQRWNLQRRTTSNQRCVSQR